jgi:hypothetical protein
MQNVQAKTQDVQDDGSMYHWHLCAMHRFDPTIDLKTEVLTTPVSLDFKRKVRLAAELNQQTAAAFVRSAVLRRLEEHFRPEPRRRTRGSK